MRSLRGQVAVAVGELLGLAAFMPVLAGSAVAAPSGVSAGSAGAVARSAAAVAGPAKVTVPVPLGAHAEVADAFARQGANACTWTVGSPGIEKTFTFDALAGTYEMTSFKNSLVHPALQYITAGAPSAEFRFTWDGATLSGDSGGWSCQSGQASQINAGGAPALQLDVSLTRPSAGVAVTKHYVIYPDVALIREWIDYANTDTSAHQLTQPSFLEQKVMGDTVADTDLLTMGGSFDYSISATPLTADYSNTISGSASSNMPWYALWNRVAKAGIYAGFDFMGSWSVPVGLRDGSGTALSMYISDYDQPLAAGASITSPKAFDAVYKTDLDDMTNRLLDWQYGYMWDYTRAPYFTAVRNEGFWCEGASWYGCFDQTVPGWDQQGTMLKVFDLSDSLRAMGVNTYHRDNGWYASDQWADGWQGEDWKITHDYLSKSGMAQIIYMPMSGDMGDPAQAALVKNTLISLAGKWGDYEFRPDFGSFPTLAADQGYRGAIQGFLDARPGSGFHAVNGGGSDYGYDYLRFADGGSFTDEGGAPLIDGASRIFPVDKLSGVPEFVSAVYACDDTWVAAQLVWNPDMYGDSENPAIVACVRKMTDLYHYITAQGVAGRWVGQYHPRASDGVDSNWFQRVSGDRQRSLIVYKGGMRCSNVCGDVLPLSAADVTVYPKGLNPGQIYDVRFEYRPGVSHRSGADLMAHGVTFAGAVHAGELIWLNLPGHPGAGTDHAPPSAPRSVTAATATNMSFPGVDVTWAAAKDNNWVSYYQVLRDGKVIGTAATGTYYFDHTPAATPTATYAVRAVDGDGNIGRATSASPASGPAGITADDAAADITYTGNWDHQAGVNGPFNGTQSQTKDLPCHTACLGFSGTQGQGGWGYQDGPPPACQQACQQFSGVQGQDNWSYQEQSGPTPPPCHLACQQFSGVQGQDGWSYQTATDGVWADIATYHEPFGLFSECCAWYDISDTTFSGLVSPRYMLSGAGHDTARAWTAPKDGVADITARAIPYISGNNAVLTITQNGQPIWGPQTIDGTTTPQDTSVANVAVTAGDVIRFEVKGVATLTLSNLLQWDPDIRYQGDPPPPPPPPPPPFADMATYHAGEDLSLDGEFWHDDNGYLSARLEQPGSDRDVARAWTAPIDGVVDITGRVAADALDASQSASTVSITKNDQVIWGPKLIAAGDISGMDAAVPAVAVSAGDVIRFQVAARSGTVAWDPDVTYQGDPPVVSPPSPWTDMATFHSGEDFASDGPFWHDSLGYVSARMLESAQRRDVARTWTAPVDGTIDITGRAVGRGSTVTITKNGQAIWGPQTAGDVGTSVAGVTVAAGDVIRFQVAAGLAGSGNPTHWDPDVSYEGGPPPVVRSVSASWTFTGSQVTWYAKLGPDKGIAQVLIDGTLDATIDLYAPDVNNYSIPIYTKTFPAAGTHTIAILPTGNLNPRSTAWTVDVDGFRAVTGAVAVTEDSAPGVSYSGSGWAAQAAAPASAGQAMVTSQAGDSVSFAFTGRSITWTGRICPSCGVADVYLDGRYVTRIDSYVYRGPDVWQAALFQYSWASLGSHVIKLVITDQPDWSSKGSQIYVDNFRVG